MQTLEADSFGEMGSFLLCRGSKQKAPRRTSSERGSFSLLMALLMADSKIVAISYCHNVVWRRGGSNSFARNKAS